MAEFSVSELKLFENIFIQGGYVLDFSNPSFRQFILKSTNIDVHDEEYLNTVANEMGSVSKGKTLMYFINNESETNVLKLLSELIEYVEVIDYEEYGITLKQLNKAKEIISKHESNKINIDLPKLGSDEIKVFISYSSQDYKEAKKIYNMFKCGEIDCFLAQHNLKGGNKWEPIIFQKLINSNFFILILSNNFLNSTWCNQEASIAFLQYEINDAALIPIKIDNTEPYGIFQGVQRVSYEDFDSLEKFVELIDTRSFSFGNAIEKAKTKKIKYLIGKLQESKSYTESNKIFIKLDSVNLSLPQVNKIIEIAIVNNQVSHCDEAPKFLTKYMDIYEGELDDKKVEIFKSYWRL